MRIVFGNALLPTAAYRVSLSFDGEPLRLRGYNRHEWHPNYGPCTPTLQMALDRDLGCNFVRGAHYPRDQRFLDLYDELGFLVWEENLGWQNSMAALAHPRFRADHHRSMQAMVNANYNHPCVIIWGFSTRRTPTTTRSARCWRKSPVSCASAIRRAWSATPRASPRRTVISTSWT